MKVSKKQLRNIVREAVRRKLELGHTGAPINVEPLDIDGPFVTMEQLQRVIDEEYEAALIEQMELNEELGNWSPGMTMGKKPSSPPPLPPHAKGSTPAPLRKGSAPGERLRQFKSNVNMMANAVAKAQEGGVREALPWLE